MDSPGPADNLVMKFCIISLFGLFLTISPLLAQETMEYFIPEPPKKSIVPENPEAPPRQFRGLFLGQGLDELKKALAGDGYFSFRGDRDVSLLPAREETLVESTGLSYIRRAFFQLSGGAVYIMSFSLDTRVMDHYSVYTSFVRKYGLPGALSPGEAVWETEETRVSIERPLTIKYIDKKVFDRLVEESRAAENYEMLAREEFLNEF